MLGGTGRRRRVAALVRSRSAQPHPAAEQAGQRVPQSPQDLGTIDYHIVVDAHAAGRDVHDYDSLIDAIAEGYRKSPQIEDVTYRIPNPLDFVEIILPNALLFLTPAELDEVADQILRSGHPRLGCAQPRAAADAAGDAR